MALAGNHHSRQAFGRTHCHVHIFRLHYAQQVGSSALAEHAMVAAAVDAGDPRAAAEAMRENLEVSRDRLRPSRC